MQFAYSEVGYLANKSSTEQCAMGGHKLGMGLCSKYNKPMFQRLALINRRYVTCRVLVHGATYGRPGLSGCCYLDGRGVHGGDGTGWRCVRREADPRLLNRGRRGRMGRPHPVPRHWYWYWRQAKIGGLLSLPVFKHTIYLFIMTLLTDYILYDYLLSSEIPAWDPQWTV
jgi:hypothetical protein